MSSTRTDIYGEFDKFLENSIIIKSGFPPFDSESNVFCPDVLDELVKRYVIQFIGKIDKKNNKNDANDGNNSEKKIEGEVEER